MSARPHPWYVKNSQWMAIALLVMRSQAAEMYRLDAGNTQVSFTVHHLGIHWITARFSDISGQFVFDQRSATSRVDVTVGVASLESGERRWNERLRSAAWLDVP